MFLRSTTEHENRVLSALWCHVVFPLNKGCAAERQGVVCSSLQNPSRQLLKASPSSPFCKGDFQRETESRKCLNLLCADKNAKKPGPIDASGRNLNSVPLAPARERG
jgi:hypothetical protein